MSGMLLPPGAPSPPCQAGFGSMPEVPPPVPEQLLEVQAGVPQTVSFCEVTPALAVIAEQSKWDCCVSKPTADGARLVPPTDSTWGETAGHPVPNPTSPEEATYITGLPPGLVAGRLASWAVSPVNSAAVPQLIETTSTLSVSTASTTPATSADMLVLATSTSTIPAPGAAA